jgi:hypothetical protein
MERCACSTETAFSPPKLTCTQMARQRRNGCGHTGRSPQDSDGLLSAPMWRIWLARDSSRTVVVVRNRTHQLFIAR